MVPACFLTKSVKMMRGAGAAIIIHGRCCEVVLGALEVFFKKAREWQSKYIPFGTFYFR